MKNIIALLKKDAIRTPLFYGLLSVGFAALVSYGDSFPLENWIWNVILTRVDLGRDILTAIATSLLTMSTITFSVMTMAMNTYATQYSPRTLPNFYSDPVTIRAKSLFVAGFLYSILSLLLMKNKVSENYVLAPAVAVVLSVFIVGYFMYFIQYVSQMTQVNNLLTLLSKEALKILQDKGKKGALGRQGEYLSPKDSYVVKAKESGYVQHAGIDKLIKIASRYSLVVELLPRIGEYVTVHSPYIRVWGLDRLNRNARNKALARITKEIPLGKVRSNTGDLEYMLQKITEVALRSISPSINDPNTAIYAVRELSQILITLGKTKHGMLPYQDHSGAIRFILHTLQFDRLLYKTFYQVVHYARQDLSVMSELVHTVGHLYQYGDPTIRPAIRSFGEHVIAALDRSILFPWDEEYWEQIINAMQEQVGGSCLR